MNSFLKVSFFLLVIVLAVSSCRPDENFITDSSASLEFSVDTLRFDTVFTELGSATRFFKVYNRNDQPIKISNIKIEGTNGAFFRMNVDGIPSNEQMDVEIRAQDSIYVFAEVTVDPDQPLSASPFVIEDYIIFETNGNQQRILLEAWGQNANYFPDQYSSGEIWSPCISNNVTWNDPKPYVIYGIMVLDNCTLTIPAGTQIYMHGGITRNDQLGVFNEGLIFVQRGGTLKMEGTLEDPVVIQGDRIEKEFEERAGQWSGIFIDNESKSNQIDWMVLKNSSLGVVVDSAANLIIRNSKIFNTTSVGLVGVHSRITAVNCLIHSNGGNAMQFIYGGDYRISYCTMASYGVDAAALSMSNGVCLDDFCEFAAGNDLNANFNNCIILGNRQDEIGLTDFNERTGAELNYSLKNCIVRVKDLTDETKEGSHPDFFSFCNPCINFNSGDAVFRDTDMDDYHLDTLSIAERQAVPISGIDFDLDGVARGTDADIGCYEFVPR